MLDNHIPSSCIVENDHNFEFDNAKMNCLSVNVCNKYANSTQKSNKLLGN